MKSAIIILFWAIFGIQLYALNPQLPPGSNFDLSAWKVQTLDDNFKLFTAYSADLVNGYTSQFFNTNPSDGSLVFKVPSNGEAITGATGYPRVELRQMSAGANWSLSDPTEHSLTAQCKVLAVAQAKPQTIIGQIHGSETNSELLKIRWTGYQAGQCKIEARYELNDATQAEYGVTLASGLSLGDLIDYIITMKNGAINCTVNGVSASQTYSTTYFGSTDAYYFKAGNYFQYNPQTVPDPTVIYGQNQFYKLSLIKQITDVQNIADINQFSIYQLPAENKLCINSISPSPQKIAIGLYDSNGRLIKKTNINTNQNQIIDVSELASGVYFVKSETPTFSKTTKLVYIRK